MKKPPKWLPLFEEFVGDLRINSKEETNPDGTGIPLVLWESQKRFLKEVAEGLDRGVKTFYCLKSRQLGITTVSLAVDLFWVAMNPGLAMAIVTENESNREKNRAVLRQYINSFPDGYFGDDFYITKGGDNRQSMRFSNGSRFDFKVAGTQNKGTSWGEGEGYGAAHLTELASYGSEDGLKSFEEAFAQNNPNSIYIYESTAKGFNLWRDKWMEGLSDPLTKRSFFIGWWASGVNRIMRTDPRFPIYGTEKPNREEAEKIAQVKADYDYEIEPEQLAWYRWRESTDAGGDMLSQNQPTTAQEAFVISGQSFFQTRQLAKDMKTIEDGGEEYGWLGYKYEYGYNFFDMRCLPCDDDDDAEDIELRVWEEPVEGGRYVIGCDPAYGRNDHKDNIAIAVFRCYADKLVQVAEYATYQTEVKFAAWALAHLAGAYSNCIVNLEVYGGGTMIMLEWDHIRQLIDNQFTLAGERDGNWTNALSNARWYLYNRPDSMGAGYCYNFSTTSKSKQELMHGLRSSYVTREIAIRSIPMLREMAIVVQNDGSIGAPESRDPNSKDDRVFAAAFAHRAWINWRRPEMMAENLTYQVVTDEETGVTSRASRTINGLITRFWKKAIAEANGEGDPEPPPTWRVDRGLA